MKNENKNYAFILLVIIFVILSLSSLIYLTNNLEDSEKIKELLSIVTTIISGILSGIVAYGIAFYQINHQKNNEKNAQHNQSLNSLKRVLIEIEDNMNASESFSMDKKSVKEDLSIFKFSISSEFWRITCARIEETDELLSCLYSYYKDVSMLKDLTSDDLSVEILQEFVSSQKDTYEYVCHYISNKSDK